MLTALKPISAQVPLSGPYGASYFTSKFTAMNPITSFKLSPSVLCSLNCSRTGIYEFPSRDCR